MSLKVRILILAQVLLMFFPGILFAQHSESDSLTNLLKNSKGEEKYKLLIKLSESDSYTEEGIKYAEEAVDVAKKLGYKFLVDAYENLAITYFDNNRSDEALTYFWKMYEVSNNNQFTPGLLKAYKGLLPTYFYLDSFEKSEQYARQLLNLSLKEDSLGYQAYAHFWLGRDIHALGNTDSALVFINNALEIYKRTGDHKEIAKIYNSLGDIYYDDAKYNKAVEYYKKEIEVKEAMHDEPQYLAIAYLNLGSTFIALSEFQQALEQYQKALRTFESIGVEEGIAAANFGIGQIYENLSQSALATKENETNYLKAVENYKSALHLYRKMGFVEKEGQTLLALGTVYSRLVTNKYAEQFGEEWEDSLYRVKQADILQSFDSSLYYYNRALDIFTEQKVEREIAKVNTNVGSIYSWAREWGKAYSFISKAVSLCRKNNLQYELSAALYALGESDFRQSELKNAEKTFLECAQLSKSLDLKETLRYCYDRLSRLYDQQGQSVLALSYLKKSVRIKDEIFTEKSQKVIAELQTKYETEKKEQELKLMKNQDELQKSIIQRQKLMIIGAIIGSLLILIVALLMFKMFRDKQRANVVLEEKNALITSQKQEITDSIKYASRIQTAVLPSSNLIADAIPEHFVLFLPRDIVSGDFYWMTCKNDKIVLVAADCTGHGVPGAFMSMLGVSFLYEIVNKESILQPSEILNRLRNHIKTTLSQTGKIEEQKDGMDISLCVIDKQNKQLEWAGAFNPLYQIRKGELIEYKADKMPVAVHINDYKSFTNHEVEIQPGDTFYMFSDGFSDQFGGADGRKFMSKKFKEKLLSIWDKPMEEQRALLLTAHLDWRGDHDQVDDVLVIGFRM